MKIKVITWNVQYSADLNEITGTLVKLKNEFKPDVLLLQELVTNAVLSYRPDMPEHIYKKLDYNYFTKKHMNKTFRFTENVGIYSPHEFIDADTAVINDRKGIQNACIKFEDNIVSFYSVYLTSPVVNPKAYYEECDELLEFVGKLPENTVIGGDLNSKKQADLIKRLKNKLSHPDKELMTWHKRLPIDMQLDYIFTTKGLKFVLYKTINIGSSDHLPVIAELELVK